MRRGSWVVGVLGLVVAGTAGATVRPLAAQQTASQLVIFRVLPATHASVAPVTKPMSLQGDHGESRTNWSITTSQPDRKILASLDRALPRGSALVVNLTAPTGASSVGPVVLDTIATDVVTGIPAVTQGELPLRYLVSADPAASRAAADAQVVTVTYTVVEQP